MKLKANPHYEAGFVKAVDDDLSPEERAALEAAAARRRIALIVGAAVIVVGVLAAGAIHLRRDTPAKQLARAKVYAQQGQHRSAQIELKRSLQEQPQQPEARFLLGNELTVLGDVKGAAIEYRKALQDGYPAERVIVPLVRAVSDQGDYPEVIALVNDASAEAPEVNAELQTMLGTAYLATGKSDAGMSALAAARDLVPGFSGAAIAEARYLASQGEYDAAAAKLSSIPSDDKRQAEMQSLEGDIARAQKRPVDAVVAYRAALKINAFDQETRIRLAQVYVDLNQLDAAHEQIALIIRANPRDGRGQFLAAMVAYLRHDIPAARDAVQKALEAAIAGNGKVQLLAGIVFVESGELIEAELHLRNAIQSLDQSAEARRALVKLYLARQEPIHAFDTLQPALGALPDDPELNALNVRIALMKGDAVAASDLFERFAARRSMDANGSLLGASLLLGAGKADAAVARLDAAAKAYPDNPEIDAALLMTHLQMRRLDAAMADWRQLDRKKPDDARAYKLRSQIEIVAGDAVKARQSLEHAVALDPSYLPAVTDLAALDLRDGHPDEARARLRAFVASQPHATAARLFLANAEEAPGGKIAAGVESLAAARAGDPTSLDVVNATVAFQVRQNDPAAALAAAQYGLTIAPNDQQLLAAVGDLAQRTGKMNEALNALTKLTQLNAENADYSVRLGIAQLAGGQSEAALISFRNGVKQAPRRLDLPGATVEAFLAAGKPEEANRLMFDVASNWPAHTAMIDELNADVKLASRQFPEAIAAYTQALAAAPSTRLAIKTYGAMMLAKQRGQARTLLVDWETKHPDDAAMLLFEAQAAIDTKDYGAAASAYRKALVVRPDDPTVLNNLAWVLAQRNDPDALAYARKAVGFLPASADAADTLGSILMQQGMTQQAIDALTRASSLAPEKLDIRLRLAKAQIKGQQGDAARLSLRSIADKAPDSVEGKESRQLLTTM